MVHINAAIFDLLHLQDSTGQLRSVHFIFFSLMFETYLFCDTTSFLQDSSLESFSFSDEDEEFWPSRFLFMQLRARPFTNYHTKQTLYQPP